MSAELRAVRHEDILVITLGHPSGLPRLERRVLRELSDQIERLLAERACIGAVITGSMQAFSAGAELEEIAALRPAEAFEFSREGQRVMAGVERSRKPVIAAIRGYCMGGGFDLALACRARIAGHNAVFAHRGATLGLVTGWGGTQRLTRLLGHGKANEIFLTGMKIGADEALALGLIHEIAAGDELLARAMNLARSVALQEKSIQARE